MVTVYKGLNEGIFTSEKIAKADFPTAIALFGKGVSGTAHAQRTDTSGVAAYTVPTGKVFFLISARVVHVTTTGSAAYGYLLVGQNFGSAVAMLRTYLPTTDSQTQDGITPSVLVRFESGTKFLAFVDFVAGTAIDVIVQGIEIDLARLPNDYG